MTNAKENFVNNLIEEGFTFTENIEEAIYILEDGKMVSGDFVDGFRTTDHRMMECFIDDLDRYDNGFWDAVFDRFNVVMMIPETGFSLIKADQPLTAIQKELLDASGYTVEYN